METWDEREVAQLLRCSAACLRRMRRERRGPRWTRVGRLVRYPRAWLEDYIGANEGGGLPASVAEGSKREEHQ